VVERSSKAADLRARLQLTERTQSSLEEEARSQREEVDYLRAELEDERSMGFFRRLLGGLERPGRATRSNRRRCGSCGK
jgi:hypothetical protein